MKDFYKSKTGRIVRRALSAQISTLWQHCDQLEVMGLGYAEPYLGQYESAARLFAFTPEDYESYTWKNTNSGNKVAHVNSNALPLRHEVVERILMVHHLETTKNIKQSLKEAWRCLKPGGKMIVIVPNRLGLWAQAEWSPFGHGSPFSMTQILFYLEDAGFLVENTSEALFIPPSQNNFVLRLSNFFERIGSRVLPIVSGVHVIEVSKQVAAFTAPTEVKFSKNVNSELIAKPTA